MMQQSKCPSCATPLPAGAVACPKCGAAVATSLIDARLAATAHIPAADLPTPQPRTPGVATTAGEAHSATGGILTQTKMMDALRSATLSLTDDSLRADLAPLLPELGTDTPGGDRHRLFPKFQENCAAEEMQEAAAPAYQVDPLTAGSISGMIRYIGKRPLPKKIDMSGDPACVEEHHGNALDEPLAVSSKGGLANAFVYVKSVRAPDAVSTSAGTDGGS